MRPAGQRVDRQVLIQMRDYPCDEIAHPIAGCGLGFERGARRRLFSTSQHGQRQCACDLHRYRTTKVVLDQRQGELDARGDARRRPHGAVTNVYSLALHPHLRSCGLESVADTPVGRGIAAVEQSRCGERECPAANAGDAMDR